MGVLISSDGSVTLPFLLIVIGIPIFAIGYHLDRSTSLRGYSIFGKPVQYVSGMALIVLGVMIAALAAFEDKRKRKVPNCNSLTAQEILNELKTLSMKKMTETSSEDDRFLLQGEVESAEERGVLSKSVKCLNSLALKCAREKKRRVALQKRTEYGKQLDTKPLESSNQHVNHGTDRLKYKPHEIEMICQEAAHIVLGMHHPQDEVVLSALSLLAFVAGDEEVRRRSIEDADRFGLYNPIRCMRASLKRTKDCEEPNIDKEQLSAQIQQKGCLYLGALCDGNKDIATKAVDEGGLLAVLDAVDWFRFHADVSKLALWAVFLLCYDHIGNKGELVRLGGIKIICSTMKSVPKQLEVARHGTAVLFDLLREVPGSTADLLEIRRIALNAGMHEAVVAAMDDFPDIADIMMMGRTMLQATGYSGDMPSFEGTIT